MKNISRIICVVLSALILVLNVGCNVGYQKSIIYFELSDEPLSLDPQTVSTNNEMLIVSNIFEGLLRKDKNGEIVNGAAEEITKDGLTYTFKLRDGIKWSSGESLTANDFVFGIKRGIDPKTESPFAYSLMSIENAKAVNKGEKPLSELGIMSVDEKTLVITLEFEDEDFYETLTSPIAMPCNEKLFEESGGQYGLESEFIYSNGSYRLTKWSKENFGIRIYKNEDYNGDFVAENAGVFFSKSDEDAEPYKLLKENDTDMAFVDNSEAETLRSEGFGVASRENICWILTIGNDFSASAKEAFVKAISANVYNGDLKYGFRAATSLYPDCIGADIQSNPTLESYDIGGAQRIFHSVLASYEDKKFPTTTLYYYEDDDFKRVVTSIVAHWQNNLSAYINIKGESSINSFEDEAKLKSKPFAVFPIAVTSNDAEEYLRNFGNYGSQDLLSVQNGILASNSVVPLAFETTDIAYNNALENVILQNGNGYIDFSFIIKK